MTRGLYLSLPDALLMADSIISNTGLRAEIDEYEEKHHWYYVTVYDLEGHAIDSVDTAEEALELVRAYREHKDG